MPNIAPKYSSHFWGKTNAYNPPMKEQKINWIGDKKPYPYIPQEAKTMHYLTNFDLSGTVSADRDVDVDELPGLRWL